MTCNICNTTVSREGNKKFHLILQIQFISLDNQLISVVGDQGFHCFVGFKQQSM